MNVYLLTFMTAFFLLTTGTGEETSLNTLSLVEQKIIDIESDTSFGIVLAIYQEVEGEKIYRLGLIQGSTSIETSNLTHGEYVYFTKGIENTLSQSKIISQDGNCGSKLRLRQIQSSGQTVICFRNEESVLRSTHDWVVLAREFIWMKKTQENKNGRP